MVECLYRNKKKIELKNNETTTTKIKWKQMEDIDNNDDAITATTTKIFN